MGDLEADTAVEPVGDGRYQATLSAEWEIWGPMGGYVAAVALRAAAAESPFSRPATFSCQYLGVAGFEPVDIAVTTVRQARTACAQRVELTQAGRPIVEAAVWSVGAVDGLTHHVAIPPDVPGPLDAPTIHEPAPFPFWDNVESRPLDFIEPWPPSEPLPPVWRAWLRLRPRATFEDLWIDAARSVILIDVQGWPAAFRYHAWRQPPFIAPSLDLSVAFHEPATDTPWLLADGFAPTAGAGLIGWTGRLWTDAGRLVASGGGQLLCRRLPPPA